MPSITFPQALSTTLPRAVESSQTWRLIEAHDWPSTSVGPMAAWPAALQEATRLMLVSPVPMVLLMGPDGVMIYNDAYAALAGGRHPALLGLPVLDGWPEVAEFNRSVMEAGFRGETLSFENQELTLHRHNRPEQVWMDLNYSPVMGENGAPEGVLAIVMETTKRVLADQTLAQSQERLSLALDAAGMVGVWDWRILENSVVANPRFARMYGVDPAEAEAGAPIERFVSGVHPEDQPALEAAIAHALAERGELRAEYRLIGEGETPRWVQAIGRVIAGNDNQPARLPGVIIDITERKEQEAALAQSEAKFRAIADSMPQMVWSTLPDGFHDYYNARWYEFTGVSPGSTDGEGWNNMFHPDDQERAWEAWRESLETGEPYQIEYRLRHHSGEYRWTLGRALPVRDETGRIVRWMGTCTDIHEAKRAAEEREVVAQELSHRIKNIFSVLTGMIALSARSFPDAKPFADQLRQRIFAMGRAHDFIRPHSAASKPQARQTSLHALINQLLAPFKGGEDHQRFRFEGEDAPVDEAAATPLALLFHELATNAAKYGAFSAKNGTVTISGHVDGGDYLMGWREDGGPPPVTGSQQGFGTRLMSLSVEGQLGGMVQRRWEPEGLRVELRIPLAALNRSGRLRAGREQSSA